MPIQLSRWHRKVCCLQCKKFCYVSQKECAEEALAPAKMKDAAATKKAVEKKEKVAAAERKVQEEAAKIANENAAATIKKAK